jgi:hypothetical protein
MHVQTPVSTGRPSKSRTLCSAVMGPLVFRPNGHVFESRAFHIENATHSPCAATGKRVPSAVPWQRSWMESSTSSRTQEVLSAPKITMDRLRSLEQLVQNMVAEKASVDEIVGAIDKEAPEVAAELRRLIPDSSNRIGWGQVLLMVLTLLLGQRQPAATEHAPSSLSNTEIEQIVRTVIDSQQSHSHQPPPKPQPPRQPNRQERRHPPRQRP